MSFQVTECTMQRFCDKCVKYKNWYDIFSTRVCWNTGVHFCGKYIEKFDVAFMFGNGCENETKRCNIFIHSSHNTTFVSWSDFASNHCMAFFFQISKFAMWLLTFLKWQNEIMHVIKFTQCVCSIPYFWYELKFPPQKRLTKINT